MAEQIFGIVKRYIDEYDYMALLAFGCPSDEFDVESRYISDKITEKSSVYEIAQIIAQIFELQFDNPEKAESFLDIAERIKKEIEQT